MNEMRPAETAELARDVDILAQRLSGVAAQEQPVEQRRFALRGKRVDLFLKCHCVTHKKCSINRLPAFRKVHHCSNAIRRSACGGSRSVSRAQALEYE